MKNIYVVSTGSDTVGRIAEFDKDKLKIFQDNSFDWAIKSVVDLDLFDEYYIFCDGYYQELGEGLNNPKVKVFGNNEYYFLRNLDSMIHGNCPNAKIPDLREHLNDDDWIFVTHQDMFFRGGFLESLLDLRINNSRLDFIAGLNSYYDPLFIDGVSHPWYGDPLMYCNVGFLRGLELYFSWGKVDRDYQQYFLDICGKPITVRGTKFLRLDDDTVQDPLAAFDGYMDGSLRMAIALQNGNLKDEQLLNIGDLHRVNSNFYHLKAFFCQDDSITNTKSIQNKIFTDCVCFGENRMDILYGHPREHQIIPMLQAIKDSPLYQCIMTPEQKQRYDEIVGGVLT